MLRTRRTAASVLAAVALSGGIAAGTGASWAPHLGAGAGTGLISVADTGWDRVHTGVLAGRPGTADTGWDRVHTSVLAGRPSTSDTGWDKRRIDADTRPAVTVLGGQDTGWD